MGGGGDIRMILLLFSECGLSGVEVVETLKPYCFKKIELIALTGGWDVKNFGRKPLRSSPTGHLVEFVGVVVESKTRTFSL